MLCLKNFLKILILIQFLSFLTNELNGQESDTGRDHQSTQISQEDIIAALQTLNIQIYKFKVNLPISQKCNVYIYQQEYEKRNKLSDEVLWGTPNPFRALENGVEVQKALEEIRIITKGDKQDYTLNIKMGDFSLLYHIKPDTAYKKPHGCKPFMLPNDFSIGSKIPLLLIGSYWDSSSKEGAMSIERFCMENEMNPDFSNKAFDVMPHYYIFGISIVESKK